MRCRVRGAGVRRGGLCIAIGRYAPWLYRGGSVWQRCVRSVRCSQGRRDGLCLDGQRVLHDLPAHDAGVHMTQACMRRTRMLAAHHITRRATARRPIAAHRIPLPPRAAQCPLPAQLLLARFGRHDLVFQRLQFAVSERATGRAESERERVLCVCVRMHVFT